MEYQADLAQRLSEIILVSDHPNITLKFVKAFFFILNREWLAIDHYRIDKFYKLVRQMLYASLDWLAKEKWDLTIVNAYSTLILEEEIIRPDESVTSDIFRFTRDLILPYLWTTHKDVCRSYPLLVSTNVNQIPWPSLKLIIQPYLRLVVRTNDKDTVNEFVSYSLRFIFLVVFESSL